MPRPLTFIPPGGALVETCTRTIQGRYLLRPSPELDDVIVGVLGRAIRYAGVRLSACAFASNHYHLLYWAENALAMSRFQGYFNANLAKEICRLNDWGDKVWARRYKPLIVDANPEAQWQRLRYVLAQGTKEGLVENPLDWPGVNGARALVEDRPLVGHWYNRTREWAARRRGEVIEKYDYATRYEVELEPLPTFRDLPPERYRQQVVGLVEEIAAEAAVERDGHAPMGVAAVRAEHPHHRPAKVKKSPASKLFFAVTQDARDVLRDEFRAFVAHYRSAADLLLQMVAAGGNSNPAREFPIGSFPPAMPFVGATMPPPVTPPTRRIEEIGSGRSRRIVRHEVPTVRVPIARDPPVAS